MKHFHKAVHHVKKALKHSQSGKLILLFVLVLSLPILVFALNQQTQIKQQAANGAVCQQNGGSCKTTCLTNENTNGATSSLDDCSVGQFCCIPNANPNPAPPAGATNGCNQKYGVRAYCISTSNNQYVQNGCSGGPEDSASGLCGTGQVCCTSGGKSNSPCTGYCAQTANNTADSQDPSGNADCANKNSGNFAFLCWHAAAQSNGNQCGGCDVNVKCGLDGQYCGNNIMNGTTYSGTQKIFQCQLGYWQFLYNQTAAQCTVGTTAPPIIVSQPVQPVQPGPGNPGKPIQPGKPIAPSTTCACDQKGAVAPNNGFTCTTNGVAGQSQKCASTAVCDPARGSSPNNPCVSISNLNVSCACKAPTNSNSYYPNNANGYGAPYNHFICTIKNYNTIAKEGDCSRNAICDIGRPSSQLNPCYTPPTSNPVCTCKETNSPDQNGYYCTNDAPNQGDLFWSTPHNCGTQNSDGTGPNWKCTAGSSVGHSPCEGPNSRIQSTLNTAYISVTIPSLTRPLQTVDIELHFLKMVGGNPQKPPTVVKTKLYYDSAAKKYINHNYNMDNVTPGDYLIFAKADGYLVSQLLDPKGNKQLHIDPTKDFFSQTITLVPGDIAPSPHGDNFIDIYDYNLVVGCFGKQPVNECKLADLNNDGKIDENDAKYIMDHFWQFGDSYTEANFSCVSDPTCTTGTGTLQMCALKCTKNIDF